MYEATSLDRQLNELLGYSVTPVGNKFVLCEPAGHEYPALYATEREAWHDAPAWSLENLVELYDMVGQYRVLLFNDPARGEWYARIGTSGVHHGPRLADVIVACLVEHLRTAAAARGGI